VPIVQCDARGRRHKATLIALVSTDGDADQHR